MNINHKPSDQSHVSRRQFLGFAWLGALAVLGAQTLGAIFNFLKPVNTGGFGGIVYAGKVAEFPPGSINHVQAGRFYLRRYEDGSFIAFWQRCTHLGCSVPWVEGEAQFHCPCHGSLYDEHGEVTGGPAPRPMDIFPVTIQNGEVYVDTGNPIQRAEFDPSQTTKA
jgi:cytochrome b6-f complex iron-sulfur subunit